MADIMRDLALLLLAREGGNPALEGALEALRSAGAAAFGDNWDTAAEHAIGAAMARVASTGAYGREIEQTFEGLFRRIMHSTCDEVYHNGADTDLRDVERAPERLILRAMDLHEAILTALSPKLPRSST